MNKIKCEVKIFTLSALLLLFPSSFIYAQSVRSELQKIIQNSQANDAFWSITARDSLGKLLLDYNSDKVVRPASNLKLVTSAAILNELGPDFTYKTYVYGVGYQQGDTWKGDIIIRGSGDPSISGTLYMGYRFKVFEEIADSLDSLGIRNIDGNLIGNDSYFDQQPYPKGWSWQDLSYYYGVETSALSFNNNAVDLQVYADGPIGETPRIQWFPFDTDYVEFLNEQTIAPANTEYDEFYRRILGTNTIILGSRLPKGYHEEESLSVLDASDYFMDTFKKYLEDRDINITGQVVIDSQPTKWDSDDYQVLTMHESKPLSVLLKEINTESNNFYTEMMLKTAAAEKYGTQGSTDLGISLVKEFAHSMKMDTTRLEMNDGSGMAASTLIKASDLTLLLSNMQGRPNFSVYKQSMSVAGVDGTLENRFLNTPLQNHVTGKTGYISGVRAVSGYATVSSGKTVIFSIFTNNYTNKTSYIDNLQKQLLMEIYKAY